MSKASLQKTANGIRKPVGASMIVLVLVIAFFVILPLSLLAIEIGRVQIARTQLKNVTDSAALAGTAAIASSPQGFSYTDLQNLAMDVAVGTFQQNSIAETSFNTTNVKVNKNNGTTTTKPPVHEAVLNITLLDEDGNPQPTGSQTATTMRIDAYFTTHTMFASGLMPIMPEFTVRALSDGGLPMLDIILCFDVSGSMDDQTPVQFVRRYWDPARGYLSYRTVRSGTIYDATRPVKTGTGLNALRPQNLSYASYPSPSNRRPQIFSESPYPSPNNIATLRGNQYTYPAGSLPAPLGSGLTQYPLGSLVAEQGLPPGNFDPTSPTNLSGNGVNPGAYNNGFTDMVVNVPDAPGFPFPNIETCVEASRGNLESMAILKQSQGGGAINPNLAAPRSGYYNAYWDQVAKVADPIAAARQAATDFYYMINVSSNAHFGLETFADQAGSAPNTMWSGTNANTDAGWTHGGNGQFPVPLISLDNTQSNYTASTDAINGGGATPNMLGPTGATNIKDALDTAIDQLTDNSRIRPTAKKAIVLFTDGVPNVPGGQRAASNAAKSQARRAKRKGIAIYTIGLSQNPAIKPDEDRLLGDGKNGSGRGIAYLSGNKAIYVSVTSSSQLHQAFQTIARSLVVLQ